MDLLTHAPPTTTPVVGEKIDVGAVPATGTAIAVVEAPSTDGRDNRPARWRIEIGVPARGSVTRKVSTGPTGGKLRHWADGAADSDVIWPSWYVEPADGAGPLSLVQQQCQTDTDRLRQAATWMATVIGVTLAALVGTSPLRDMRDGSPTGTAVGLGVGGLVLLSITLLLVLRVIRPDPPSFCDIQLGERAPLRRWRETVEAEQDVYLPCGITSLTALRQHLIVDELTLTALAHAVADAGDDDRALLERALQGRLARLQDLRSAMAQVVAIGGFYRVRRRSGVATWAGGLCGISGTALIVVSFLLPAA